MHTKKNKKSTFTKTKGVEKPRSIQKEYSFFENVYEVVREILKEELALMEQLQITWVQNFLPGW